MKEIITKIAEKMNFMLVRRRIFGGRKSIVCTMWLSRIESRRGIIG